LLVTANLPVFSDIPDHRLKTGLSQQGVDLPGSGVAPDAMKGRDAWRRICAVLGLSVAACISAFNAPARADPMALWRIVHSACVPHVEAGLGPKPCERVDLDDGVAQGVAILKDLVGVAQMLAIPTRRITGIEDPQMLAPNAPPVFAVAWGAKALVEARLKHALPREGIAIAINSKLARSQDQFHIHVDCVARTVAATLADNRASFDGVWRAMAVPLNGRIYFARRVDSADLADVAPLKLLADGVAGAREHMGAYSLAAVGATFDGKPGFVLLADQFSLEGGGHTEDIQDHNCAMVGAAP
jgi:CDP-diacylglycerol pyrophosphatase